MRNLLRLVLLAALLPPTVAVFIVCFVLVMCIQLTMRLAAPFR